MLDICRVADPRQRKLQPRSNRTEPAQARSEAPMRSMSRRGTVQDPPRAAVPPARGGIGPSSAAGAGRPRGGSRFHSTWAYGADRTEHLSRRASGP